MSIPVEFNLQIQTRTDRTNIQITFHSPGYNLTEAHANPPLDKIGMAGEVNSDHP